MCISTAHAELKGTKIGFVADFTTKLHHLFYANSVKNLSDGPNAMILPIPGKIKKIHDTTKFNNFMEDISRHFAPPLFRSAKLGTNMDVAKSITIEEVGAYTVLRCPVINALAIEAALTQVPQNKRPSISSELLNWYRDFYGKQSNLAICCFDSKELIKAQPMWIEYKPNDFTMGFFPGADSHDGRPPKIGTLIDRDHEVFFGAVTDSSPSKIHFSLPVPAVIQNASWLKMNNISDENGKGTNGDWVIEFGDKAPGYIEMGINTRPRSMCFS